MTDEEIKEYLKSVDVVCFYCKHNTDEEVCSGCPVRQTVNNLGDKKD